ncbi:MAG: ABC transporter permease subunit [Flavobacterium sp.]|nr:ABC transporter permease subunit [Flavobacterium sp.]
MKRLLYIELQKIWLNKASRILTFSYFILLSFIALIASIKYELGPIKLHFAEMGIFNFPYIWHFNTYFADFFKFFLAIVIVSMMANEYSYGTLKQNLIDGLSKKEFIISKFLTVLIFAFASTLFVFIMSLILGYSFSSYNEPAIVFSQMDYLLAYFIKLLGFFTFCLFAGIIIKRSAFAIGFVFIWYVAEAIIAGLVKYKYFENNKFATAIIDFLPLQAMSNLIVEPISKLSVIKSVSSQIGVDQVKDYSVHLYSILTVCFWIILFVYWSYKILKKRDL